MRPLFLLLSVLLLVGCLENKPTPLPTGMQEVQGVLQPAELSLVRRGTHLLFLQNGERLYIESTTLNLREYEGDEIRVRGIVEENTVKEDPPILRALSIERVAPSVKQVSLPSLGMILALPEDWEKFSDDPLKFVEAEATDPILTIIEGSGTVLPDGTPLVVSGRRAVRVLPEGGFFEEVHILDGRRVIALFFTPNEADPALQGEFLRILNSISFAEAYKLQTTNYNLEGTTATGALVPCGGEAGILCPKGFYCEVKDLKENIGTCRKIGK